MKEKSQGKPKGAGRAGTPMGASRAVRGRRGGWAWRQNPLHLGPQPEAKEPNDGKQKDGGAQKGR